MKLVLIIFSLFLVNSSFAQNLMDERIWKVSSRKKSIFLDSGVFHFNSKLKNSSVVSLRNSVVSGRGYERIVVDFKTPTIPKIYGHIQAHKKLSIDFFDTSIETTQPKINNSKFVKAIDFISVDGKTLTMEMSLTGKSSFDIFYLENPGRLVIDVR